MNLKTREFPARQVVTFSVSAGLNSAATGRNVVKAPSVGTEWRGVPGDARALPSDLEAAGDLSGLTSSQADALIGSLRNVWSAQSADGAPNGAPAWPWVGRTPIFKQPIGYIGSLSYDLGQEVQRERPAASPRSGASRGRPCLLTPTTARPVDARCSGAASST